MSVSKLGSGAPRPGVRRPSSGRAEDAVHPITSPVSINRNPANSRNPRGRGPESLGEILDRFDWYRVGRLFVDVAGVAHTMKYLARETGDEARVLVELIAPDGGSVVVADCVDFHQCTCPEFRADRWECDHVRALLRLGILQDPARLSCPESGDGAGEGGAP